MEPSRERDTESRVGQPAGPRNQDLAERLFEYAAAVVMVTQKLPRNFVGGHVARQLLRSGTSAGANYEEARAAESRNDFIHKLQVSLKELRESNFWLRLIARVRLANIPSLDETLDESSQLVAILSKAVATAKGKSKSGGRGSALGSLLLILGFCSVALNLCLLTFAF
ncbi:four helix bundle protein [Planctomycetota bacterium]